MTSAHHAKKDNVPTTRSGHPRCQEVVQAYWTNWPSFHQCERRAKVDGRWCKQHDPEAVKAREAERTAKWNADMATRRVELAGQRFLNALRQIADGHNDPRTLARDTIKEFER